MSAELIKIQHLTQADHYLVDCRIVPTEEKALTNLQSKRMAEIKNKKEILSFLLDLYTHCTSGQLAQVQSVILQ